MKIIIFFLEKYSYIEAFYVHSCKGGYGFNNETITMVVSYDLKMYNEALQNVKSQKGYSTSVDFLIGDFLFNLNETERIYKKQSNKESKTRFLLTTDSAYIEWINLVGYSNKNKQIAFVGFSHYVYFLNESNGYSFRGWESFFEDLFSCFDWENHT